MFDDPYIRFDRAIAQQFRTLGALHAFAVYHAWNAYFSSGSEHNRQMNYLGDYSDGVRLLSRVLDINIKRSGVVSSVNQIDDPSDFFIANVLKENSLNDQIRDQYGNSAAFNFSVVQLIFAARSLSSIFRHTDFRDVPSRRRKKIETQLKKAIIFFKFLGETLKEWGNQLEDQFGTEFKNVCFKLVAATNQSGWTKEHFKKIYALTEIPVNSLVPHYSRMSERLNRARELMANLNSCPVGKGAWQKYETICIKALRLMFIPPFRKISIQVRTEDNHERRDAILPNNQFSGFWHLIRAEFESKHVICEFKNNSTALDKDDLNQLRIYLSKPTIGRFGLLFCRGNIGESALKARRSAYEQSRILVLFIDDKMMEHLLKARAFLGDTDSILEDMKTDFEVHY